MRTSGDDSSSDRIEHKKVERPHYKKPLDVLKKMRNETLRHEIRLQRVNDIIDKFNVTRDEIHKKLADGKLPEDVSKKVKETIGSFTEEFNMSSNKAVDYGKSGERKSRNDGEETINYLHEKIQKMNTELDGLEKQWEKVTELQTKISSNDAISNTDRSLAKKRVKDIENAFEQVLHLDQKTTSLRKANNTHKIIETYIRELRTINIEGTINQSANTRNDLRKAEDQLKTLRKASHAWKQVQQIDTEFIGTLSEKSKNAGMQRVELANQAFDSFLSSFEKEYTVSSQKLGAEKTDRLVEPGKEAPSLSESLDHQARSPQNSEMKPANFQALIEKDCQWLQKLVARDKLYEIQTKPVKLSQMTRMADLLRKAPTEHRPERVEKIVEQFNKTMGEMKGKLSSLPEELQKEATEVISQLIQRAQEYSEESLKGYGKSKGRAGRNLAEKNLGEINDQLHKVNESLERVKDHPDGYKQLSKDLQEAKDQIDLRNIGGKLAEVYGPLLNHLEKRDKSNDNEEMKQSIDNFEGCLKYAQEKLKTFIDEKYIYTSCKLIEELKSRSEKLVNDLNMRFITDRNIDNKLEDIKNRYSDYSRKLSGSSTQEKKNPNEDAYFLDDKHQVHAVFDGVTGRKGGSGGHIASGIAVDYLRQSLPRLSDDLSIEEIKQNMKSISEELNKKIIENQNGNYKDMATTASIVKIMKDGTAVIGNGGDGRVYLFKNKSKSIEHLTLDNNVLSDAVKLVEGDPYKVQKRLADTEDDKLLAINIIEEEVGPKLTSELENQLGLDKQDLVFIWPMLTKCLGSKENIESDITIHQLEPDDMLLLTSDGVHDNLTDSQIADHILAKNSDPKEAADALVQAAKEKSNQHGQGISQRPKPDDMTAIVVRYPGEVRNNAETPNKEKYIHKADNESTSDSRLGNKSTEASTSMKEIEEVG